MPFSWGPRRGPAPIRARGPVFAVGQRVSVTCSGGQPTRVALTDDAGAKALGNLVDGTEVEILAWRPNGFRGARYRVRATSGGVEGWLAVAESPWSGRRCPRSAGRPRLPRRRHPRCGEREAGGHGAPVRPALRCVRR